MDDDRLAHPFSVDRPGQDPARAMARAGRGALVGVVSGVPVGLLLDVIGLMSRIAWGTLPAWSLYALYVALAGAVIGLVAPYRPEGLATSASGGVLIGMLGWLVWSLTLQPLLLGEAPSWSLDAAAQGYRTLVGALLHGGLTGLLLHAVGAVQGTRPHSARMPVAVRRPRVVIVGGGFAGVGAARRLEHRAGRKASVDVTLVNDSNFLLFTPMLAEVAAGALEPSHISAPLRSAAGRTRFRQGVVHAVDTERKTILLTSGSDEHSIAYDHVLMTAGSVPRFLDLPGVEEQAFTLKSLTDATRLRNHVLAQLERSDRLEPGDERRRLLTFVIAGGGFAGTEVAAELFDLVHGVSHFFPGVAVDEPRFVLVHIGDRILPELSAELGGYALDRLSARGIEFRLEEGLASADPAGVTLSGGERLSTATLVWTAGNQPHPVVSRVDGEHARSGALVTDSSLRVRGLDGVWAAGDCAQVPDLTHDGRPCPPTAQHALRQGRVAADNILAVVAGREPRPFRYSAPGVLVALGHRTAAAEIHGRRFSGVLAWAMWRGVYLAKLPGPAQRTRVLLDWVLDLVFPRDIVTTDPPPALGRLSAARPATSPDPARPWRRTIGTRSSVLWPASRVGWSSERPWPSSERCRVSPGSFVVVPRQWVSCSTWSSRR